jgi:hypothetical protein
VIAALATAILHDQISAERRREDVLVRKTDGVSLSFLQAEQTLRHALI